METWKEFGANELTHSAAHHLIAIDEIGRQYGGWARVSDIARHLNITRGSVSINLRTLKKRGLVETDEHHMVKLSAEGERIVHGVTAKKTAIKAMLRHVLGLSEEQAEVDSCKIEHLISGPTAERLLALVHAVLSDPGLAEQLRAKVHNHDAGCADASSCPVCEGRALGDVLKQTA
jgi:Mn-dependent DtxR family transcriptional regulator